MFQEVERGRHVCTCRRDDRFPPSLPLLSKVSPGYFTHRHFLSGEWSNFFWIQEKYSLCERLVFSPFLYTPLGSWRYKTFYLDVIKKEVFQTLPFLPPACILLHSHAPLARWGQQVSASWQWWTLFCWFLDESCVNNGPKVGERFELWSPSEDGRSPSPVKSGSRLENARGQDGVLDGDHLVFWIKER